MSDKPSLQSLIEGAGAPTAKARAPKAPKPSETQREALVRMAAADGTIRRLDGGFWSVPGIPIARRSQHLGRHYDVPSWYVAVDTVRAMERRGWVRMVDRFEAALTDAGRAVVAPEPAPAARAKRDIPSSGWKPNRWGRPGFWIGFWSDVWGEIAPEGELWRATFHSGSDVEDLGVHALEKVREVVWDHAEAYYDRYYDPDRAARGIGSPR